MAKAAQRVTLASLFEDKNIAAIARKTGIDYRLLRRWKSGEVRPAAHNLGILAAYFNVAPEQIELPAKG